MRWNPVACDGLEMAASWRRPAGSVSETDKRQERLDVLDSVVDCPACVAALAAAFTCHGGTVGAVCSRCFLLPVAGMLGQLQIERDACIHSQGVDKTPSVCAPCAKALAPLAWVRRTDCACRVPHYASCR